MNVMFAVSFLFAQCPDIQLPNHGKNLKAFTPEQWFIKDSISGDFNQDKLTDYVLVLSPIAEQSDQYDGNCMRPVVILKGVSDGFTLSSFTRKGVLCKLCGGVWGEPYEGITLNNNVLEIRHYAGSNWRWAITTTFRFQKNQWQLIGYSYVSYFTAGDCDEAGSAAFNQYEANFSTGKAHIINTKDDACKPYRDVWKTFAKKAPVWLSAYDVEKDYFPLKK